MTKHTPRPQHTQKLIYFYRHCPQKPNCKKTGCFSETISEKQEKNKTITVSIDSLANTNWNLSNYFLQRSRIQQDDSVPSSEY